MNPYENILDKNFNLKIVNLVENLNFLIKFVSICICIKSNKIIKIYGVFSMSPLHKIYEVFGAPHTQL